MWYQQPDCFSRQKVVDEGEGGCYRGMRQGERASFTRGARGRGMPQDKRDDVNGRLKDESAQRVHAEVPKVQ